VADLTIAAHSNLDRFLGQALARLRWGTIAGLLLLEVAQPATGLFGVPTWQLGVFFAVYTLLLGLARSQLGLLRSFVWRAIFDLPVAATLYYLGGEPGGPLFVLFLLAVDLAAASMQLRGTLAYTAVAAATAGGIELLLQMWSPTGMDVRGLGLRLLTLALMAIGMLIVTRRLGLERADADAMRSEADQTALLERLRADFVSTISHDLRTPVTAARAGLGLLETSASERLRADEGDLLSNARRNIERLNLLIDDLLAYNQLEAGTLSLQREPLDLRHVVREAVAAVQPLLREKRQRLTVDLPDPLPVLGDARRLEQVALNLLANACWHTPAETLVAVSGRASATEVHLVVSDDGPGIPAEEQAAIFDRWHRLNPTDAGSGLGLAIARALVELHNGTIRVESSQGQGSAFHVTLPRRA